MTANDPAVAPLHRRQELDEVMERMGTCRERKSPGSQLNSSLIFTLQPSEGWMDHGHLLTD